MDWFNVASLGFMLELSIRYYIGSLHNHIRCGLTARISRFHRGGRGSIPRTGTSSFVFDLVSFVRVDDSFFFPVIRMPSFLLLVEKSSD
jgi:hypothetical protein